jgi:hypothetical protein
MNVNNPFRTECPPDSFVGNFQPGTIYENEGKIYIVLKMHPSIKFDKDLMEAIKANYGEQGVVFSACLDDGVFCFTSGYTRFPKVLGELNIRDIQPVQPHTFSIKDEVLHREQQYHEEQAPARDKVARPKRPTPKEEKPPQDADPLSDPCEMNGAGNYTITEKGKAILEGVKEDAATIDPQTIARDRNDNSWRMAQPGEMPEAVITVDSKGTVEQHADLTQQEVDDITSRLAHKGIIDAPAEGTHYTPDQLRAAIKAAGEKRFQPAPPITPSS